MEWRWFEQQAFGPVTETITYARLQYARDEVQEIENELIDKLNAAIED